MSKVSSADYPKYSSSNISIGGSNASTGVIDGILNSSYNMSDEEAAIYNYALNSLVSILPQVNTFDTDTKASIQSEVDAYKNSGIGKINDLYNSSLNNLENDIVSRFGNLDNSIFTDNLKDIESERAGAVSSFAQNILAKQSQLESDELAKRYALINLLQGMANNTYDNALKAISTALGSSSSANNYNNDLYNAISALQRTNSSNSSGTNALISNLLNNLTSSISNPTSFL